MNYHQIIKFLILFIIGLTFLFWKTGVQAGPVCPTFTEKDVLSCASELNNPRIMRLFMAEACGHCRVIRPWFEEVMQDYQGQVESKIWVKDQMTLPDSEWEICFDFSDFYCPNPTIVLGCRYGGLGFQVTETEFKNNLKCVIDYLLTLPVGSSTPSPASLIGDVNNDGKVNRSDFLLVLNTWGKISDSNKDLNKDGFINMFDLGLILKNWLP